MNYALLIYETAAGFALRTDPKKSQAYWAAWPAYTKALQDAGVMVGGAGLQLPDTATTLKLDDGRRLVQDGPYADTKEQLGGFYIINVPDLDTANGRPVFRPRREASLKSVPNWSRRAEVEGAPCVPCASQRSR
jgi:hypothetical protein